MKTLTNAECEIATGWKMPKKPISTATWIIAILLVTGLLGWGLLLACQAPFTNPYLSAMPSELLRHGEELVNYGEDTKPQGYKQFRYDRCWEYSWAIPTEDAALTIRRYADQVVDFGAGNGYWGWILEQVGCDVVCIDNFQDVRPTKFYHDVVEGSYELLPQYRDRALLLVWPPYATPMAYNAVLAWRGDTLIYVGEPAPARSTADPMFFRELLTDWKLVETVTIPQWWNHSDAVYIYTRLK